MASVPYAKRGNYSTALLSAHSIMDSIGGCARATLVYILWQIMIIIIKIIIIIIIIIIITTIIW